MDALFVSEGLSRDYTPSGAVDAGDVVVIGDVCYVAKLDIAANALGALATRGVFDVTKTTPLAISDGEAVYWNASGSYLTKTTTDKYFGVAVADAGSSATTVRVLLRSMEEVVAEQLGLANLSDVHTATATAGNILRADGVDFESVSLTRAVMVQEAVQPFPIPLTDAKVWDAPSTVLTATPGNDDLGVIDNTFLSAGPTIETGDLKNAGATTRKCRFRVPVPDNYQAGETLTLRINGGMKTTVASVSATVDAQVTESGDATTDICATAAASINSITAANKDFTLTPTNVARGDILDIVISVAVNDSGTGTAVIGQINSVTLLADTQG